MFEDLAYAARLHLYNICAVNIVVFIFAILGHISTAVAKYSVSSDGGVKSEDVGGNSY